MPTPFRIDTILANGENVGTSVNIIELNTTEKLDEIGELSFTIPANDSLASYLKTGVTFKVYESVDSYLGEFLFRDKTIQDNSGTATITVICDDSLKELTYHTVGFNRSYNFESVSDVVNDLITTIPGWSIEAESGLNETTIDYQGESVFRAIDEQRDRNGSHFRLKRNSTKILEFGFFGNFNDIIFTDLRGQTHVDSSNENIAIINNITLLEESSEIYNKIIPLGHGQGVNQLTIERAVLGNYSVLMGNNADGSNYYYFEDETSKENYRTRTRVLSFPNLRPISNSDIDIINAANALKLSAEAYTARHLEPKFTYSVDLAYLPQNLQVGDKIRLQYRGIIEGIQYIKIDDFFYVMSISKNRSADGSIGFSVEIANVDEKRTTDQDVIVDVVRDLKNINVHIPASITYSPVGPVTRRIRGSGFSDARINAMFNVRIREEVLYLNRAVMRFETSPLKSSVRTTLSGGSSAVTSAGGGDHGHIIGQLVNDVAGGYTTRRITMAMGGNFASPVIVNADLAINDTVSGVPADYIITATASGDHTHTIDIPPHTHDMTYDVFEDSIYPQTLGIIIDGIDRTVELLEQVEDLFFANSNNAYSYELDITSILQNNLKTTHTIEIYANDGRGEIECEVDMMVTVQPVRIN